MKIHDLGPAQGARHSKKRLGRGLGSGWGKTSGKGHKGQNSRSGGGVRPGFEGGQMPLMRILPKFGFTNNFRKEYSVVNLGALEVFEAGTTVNAAALLERGILRKIAPYGLKVLADGNLTKALTVQAAKFSKAAEEKLGQLGGKAETVSNAKSEK
ncbi:50S ribosomal protein L15 [Clostridia bacterium]|nr:50S ribosomal protein L15 [Clostridia bacterium]